MEKKRSKIQAVRGIGISSYKVEFSILDLYKLKQLAIELMEINRKANPNGEYTSLDDAATVLHKLFDATIGETSMEWDFLSEDKEES